MSSGRIGMRSPAKSGNLPGVTATEGMTHDYDDHSQYQRAVADTAGALIAQSVGAITLSPGDAFVVADYGSSTGANSIKAVRTAIECARAEDPARPIVAIHNDLPTNDWNQLFRNLTASPDSYLALAGPARAPACVRGVVLPSRHARGLGPPRRVVLCRALAPRAADRRGAQRLLLLRSDGKGARPRSRSRPTPTGPRSSKRARRISPPVGASWCRWSGPRPPRARSTATTATSTEVTARKLLRAMAEVATGMANNGIVDRGAVRRYVLPVYARTVDEARAPLTRADSPVHDAFTVIECRTDPVANPYYTKWLADHDAAAYARAYAAFVRGFTESSLRDHLFGPGTTGADVDAAVDEFFTRLTALRGRSRARPVRRLDTDRRTRPQLKGHTPWDGSSRRWR